MILYKNRIVITGGTGRFGLELRKIKNKYRLFFPLKTELNILKVKSIHDYLNNGIGLKLSQDRSKHIKTQVFVHLSLSNHTTLYEHFLYQANFPHQNQDHQPFFLVLVYLHDPMVQ